MKHQISRLLLLVLLAAEKCRLTWSQCIADETINQQFAAIITGDDTAVTYEVDGCCQNSICAIPCPEEVPAPSQGFAIAVYVAIGIFVCIGLASVFMIKDKAVNFFVAGRSLPLWVVILTLASQSLDSNATLGNVDLSYKYHFYDGAVLPIGLGLSLILNGIFFARKINVDNALTLPDVFAKRYGKVVEVMVSLCTIASFLCLLAGNLVGMGAILHYVSPISQAAAIWLAASLVLLYTISGGLYSVAYTDVVQAAIGFIGCVTFTSYMIANSEESAPPVSIGIPGYIYPDADSCAMYEGVPCDNDPSLCCYNTAKWCPNYPDCDRADNMAYPIGDQPSFPKEMTSPYGLKPFPNAILWNWATIFILGFGNLAALDFQARCMASKTPKIATIGCLVAGVLTFVVGIPFSYLGAITRYYYGPDSTTAVFEADTCSSILGLPTCALWVPDSSAFIKLLTHQAPKFLGGWCLISIVAASMSTCDGAILAMGTVFSHNIVRNLNSFFPCINKELITDRNLLMVSRFVCIPITAASACIAAYYKSNHSAGATGYLLIVAFDIVFASVVVPLFGCFYAKKHSSLAALLSILVGVIVRVVLEFALPKDGFLIAPYAGDEFLNYGSAASSLYPPFLDFPEELIWNPETEQCQQERYRDFTGLDSLAAPAASLLVYLTVQFLERNGPLIQFKEGGLMTGYLKDFQKDAMGKDDVDEFTDHSNGHKSDSG
jgi:Na+/proline symporter